MIVTISGTPGSGKSTVGKLIAKKLGLKHYSIGNLMRSMAKEKGLTLGELGELAKTDNGKIDHELDDMQIKPIGNGQTREIQGIHVVAQIEHPGETSTCKVGFLPHSIFRLRLQQVLNAPYH